MTEVLIQVQAITVGPQQWVVECSDCGIVAMHTGAGLDDRCLTHLEKHEVDTSGYRNRLDPDFQSTETQDSEGA